MTKLLSTLPVGAKLKFGRWNNRTLTWIVADKNRAECPENSVTLLGMNSLPAYNYDFRDQPYLNYPIRNFLNQTDPSVTYSIFGADRSDKGFLADFTQQELNSILVTHVPSGLVQRNPDYSDDRVYIPAPVEMGGGGETFYSYSSNRKFAVIPSASSGNGLIFYKYDGTQLTDDVMTRTAESSWNRPLLIISHPGSHTYNDDGHVYVWMASQYGAKNVYVLPVMNLSGDVVVTDDMDDLGYFDSIFNQPPLTPASITLPANFYSGRPMTISWGRSTDPEGTLGGYILERSIDTGTWTEVYRGSSRQYADAVPVGATNVQYRVSAYDTDRACSDWKLSSKATVINNSKPVISKANCNLGSYTNTGFMFTYHVTDADGDTVTVVEALDGNPVRTFTPTLGTNYTAGFSSTEWQKVLNGSHSYTITATDSAGESVTHTYTFTKSVTTCQGQLTTPMNADSMPTKMAISVQGIFPTGSQIQIWICNNGKDSSPTWEELTANEKFNGYVHTFTNTTKTASAWGVSVKWKLTRGTATEDCYLASIGGGFE